MPVFEAISGTVDTSVIGFARPAEADADAEALAEAELLPEPLVQPVVAPAVSARAAQRVMAMSDFFIVHLSE